MKKITNVSILVIISILLVVSMGIIGYFQANQQSTTPSIVLVSATATSLTATATTTATATSNPTFTPSPTPTIYFSIGETRPISLATPIVLPTATPTPTFEPLHGQAIGGYIFETAERVPNAPNAFFELYEWLPDNPNQLLTVRSNQKSHRIMEVVDIETGHVEYYAEYNTAIHTPIWLPVRNAVAYATFNDEDSHKGHVWIIDRHTDLSTLKSLFITEFTPPLVSLPNRRGVITTRKNGQFVQIDSPSLQNNSYITKTLPYQVDNKNSVLDDKVAQSLDKTKAIYYNEQDMLLIDFNTNTLTPIDLKNLRTKDMPPLHHIWYVHWSPKGDKVAIELVDMTVESHLYILDISTLTLTYIEDNMDFVGDLTWAPDNKHVLIYTIKGIHDSGYGLGNLFLLDTISGQKYGIAALPEGAIHLSYPPILWVNNNNYIAITLAEDEVENASLYRIKVTAYQEK